MTLLRLVILLFCNAIVTIIGFTAKQASIRCGYYHHSQDDSTPTSTSLPLDISCDVRSIAEDLWRSSTQSLESVLMSDIQIDEKSSAIVCHQEYQGEMPLPSSIPISKRFSYFEQQAQQGDPRAQHSVGLLLWNGFASATEQISIDPEASARWHAVAAVQGNLDALAVFGGCLRTGKGVGKCKNISLGLRCIEYSASTGNPSGVNKKGAMLESNDDYFNAMKLYRECYQDTSKRTNALLLFNLGYCLIYGEGIDQDAEEGEKLWRDAVALAPEEGSEEAAWFLYQQCFDKGNMEEAKHYLDIAANLGLEDALAEKQGN